MARNRGARRNHDNWRKGMLAKIHMARPKIMSKDDYGRMLGDRYGVESAADLSLDLLDDLVKHMDALARELGITLQKGDAKAKRYVGKIYALWGELERMGALEKPGKAACAAWIKRHTGVDQPKWLDVQQARSAIEALKAWVERAKKEKAGRG